MSTTQKDKSGGKPRQRSRKADQRGQKPQAPQSPKLDQEIEDQISPLIADAPADGSVPPAEVQVAPAEVPLIDEVSPRGGAPDRRRRARGGLLNRHSRTARSIDPSAFRPSRMPMRTTPHDRSSRADPLSRS